MSKTKFNQTAIGEALLAAAANLPDALLTDWLVDAAVPEVKLDEAKTMEEWKIATASYDQMKLDAQELINSPEFKAFVESLRKLSGMFAGALCYNMTDVTPKT